MNKTEVKINGKIAVEIRLNGGLFYSATEPPTPVFSYDYAVINTLGDKESNIQYQYNKEESKWYCLNNLNDLEPYGKIEAVDDIDSATHYNGKLVLQGDSEYEWSNGQWNYLGENEDGFGEVGQISRDLRETNFPTDFYITTNDIEAIGWLNINRLLEDALLRVDGSIPYLNYSIDVFDQGGSYQGTAEVEEIDGVQYVHFSCPDYPNDSVFAIDCMWWEEPITYYGSSIVCPKKYEKITYDTKDGYYYNSEDEITAPFGKNIAYNIDGYLYKNIDGTYERGNNGNPYAIDKAFSNDTKMSGDVKLLDEVIDTIGYCAFGSCSGLTSVTIGDSVTKIDGGAFVYCSGLTNITIPNSVTSIGNNAFERCSSLTSVEIPDSVTYIDRGAFHSCSGLTNITIPNSVTSIGAYTFVGCTNLAEIRFKGMTAPKFIGMIDYDHPFGFARTSSFSGDTNYCGYNVVSPKIYYPQGGVGYTSNSVGYSWLYVASVGRTSSTTYYYGNSTSKSVSVKGYGFTKVEYSPSDYSVR